ncbi:MAG: hypothetical protein MZV70_29470 [Desulfobacterales bacterium]|nr:hypothetical protein [Desulfobacterales bacterium]
MAAKTLTMAGIKRRIEDEFGLAHSEPGPSGEAPQGPQQRPRRAPGHRVRPRRRAAKKR